MSRTIRVSERDLQILAGMNCEYDQRGQKNCDVFDIRLEMKGEGADAYCPKGKGCPFLDVHGLSLEVDNDAG